ncbi:hypothetical protein L1N85_19700 [Paenibacillus alkaliterrae]|uniref:hypothetical protein n=1 Tax=Paenibacillus alkaliterrae TaxID=320909 RepID=UPI001F3D5DF4|nr:hypothetical protein [Paenibacillus alkaliterrae]MCF2940622.1 hypothetical protein [Paenibacillus alkaliterrae]
MNEAEQEKIFKKFKKVVDTRDSQKIDKALYNHLHLRAGFIAHSRHGFIETYSGRGFLDFIEHFEQCYSLSYGPFGEFNLRLKQYVLEHAELIREEFVIKAEYAERALLQSLAVKHGLTVVKASDAVSPPTTAPVEAFDCILSEKGHYEFMF